MTSCNVINTGTFDLEVETDGGHVCDFGKNFDGRSLKRSRTDTCSRDYKYLWRPWSKVVAGYVGNKEHWKDWTSDYPWCYHNDGSFWTANWDRCVGEFKKKPCFTK